MSYVVDRDSNKYGGKQQEYLNASKEIVNSTTSRYKKAVSEKADLKNLFHEVLQDLAARRNQIAFEHETKNAQKFGSRRDGQEFLGLVWMTPLHGPYVEYNEILLALIQSHLKKMKYGLKAFVEREVKEELEICQGARSSLELKIYNDENQKDWAYYLTDENYFALCKLCDVEPEMPPVWKRLEQNEEVMSKLKSKSPEIYVKLKLAIACIQMRQMYQEGRKSDWVVVTRRLEIDKKMYALSQYITWFYRDLVNDPVDQMKGKSRVAIIHEDPFLVQPLLNDVANVFKKVIECESKDASALKKLMTEFDYKLSHIMPFKRGSAAILGWFRQSMGHFHDYQVKETKDKALDMEALCSSFADFAKNYDSLVKLEKMTQTV